jgi:hypothetical protein
VGTGGERAAGRGRGAGEERARLPRRVRVHEGDVRKRREGSTRGERGGAARGRPTRRDETATRRVGETVSARARARCPASPSRATRAPPLASAMVTLSGGPKKKKTREAPERRVGRATHLRGDGGEVPAVARVLREHGRPAGHERVDERHGGVRASPRPRPLRLRVSDFEATRHFSPACWFYSAVGIRRCWACLSAVDRLRSPDEFQTDECC